MASALPSELIARIRAASIAAADAEAAEAGGGYQKIAASGDRGRPAARRSAAGHAERARRVGAARSAGARPTSTLARARRCAAALAVRVAHPRSPSCNAAARAARRRRRPTSAASSSTSRCARRPRAYDRYLERSTRRAAAALALRDARAADLARLKQDRCLARADDAGKPVGGAALASRLDELQAEGGSWERQLQLHDEVLAELVLQVGVHCAERGELLQRCRAFCAVARALALGRGRRRSRAGRAQLAAAEAEPTRRARGDGADERARARRAARQLAKLVTRTRRAKDTGRGPSCGWGNGAGDAVADGSPRPALHGSRRRIVVRTIWGAGEAAPRARGAQAALARAATPLEEPPTARAAPSSQTLRPRAMACTAVDGDQGGESARAPRAAAAARRAAGGRGGGGGGEAGEPVGGVVDHVAARDAEARRHVWSQGGRRRRERRRRAARGGSGGRASIWAPRKVLVRHKFESTRDGNGPAGAHLEPA